MADASAETLEAVTTERKPLLVMIAKGSWNRLQSGDFHQSLMTQLSSVSIKFKSGENAEVCDSSQSITR